MIYSIFKYGSLGDLVQVSNIVSRSKIDAQIYCSSRYTAILSSEFPDIVFKPCKSRFSFLLKVLFYFRTPLVLHCHMIFDVVFLLRLGFMRSWTRSSFFSFFFPCHLKFYDDFTSRESKIISLLGISTASLHVDMQPKFLTLNKTNVGVIAFGGNSLMHAGGRAFSIEFSVMICEYLLELGLNVCIIGVPNQHISSFSKSSTLSILGDNCSPQTLSDFFRSNNLFITCDVGLSHFAFASNKPILHFSGATNQSLIYELNQRENVTCSLSTAKCSPCYFEKGDKKTSPIKCSHHCCMSYKSFPDFKAVIKRFISLHCRKFEA